MSQADYLTGRLPAQALLHQRYLIEGCVGQGGMGAVYRALDTQVARRQVAIKEMRQTQLSEAERAVAAQRFQAEMALLASLAHPHLPRVYEAFSEQGRFYLVMDYLEGKTIAQILTEAGGNPLPVAQVVSYGYQLCTVLAYLHQHVPPIIFRDLKPANVMVTPHGQVFLIDFGIARLFKVGQQQDTAFLGSPGYASPEQHGLAQTTPRSDLYSLGATLYGCLTAKDPSAAGNRFLFLPVRQYNPEVSPELEQLVQRLVAVDPQQRPANALEVQQALLAISQQSAAPTEALAPVLAATQYLHPAPASLPPAAPAPAVHAAPPTAQPFAFGQAGPLPAPTQFSPAQQPTRPVWSLAFSTLWGLLLALMVGGSLYAFQTITGSDHLVEFALALLWLFVALGSGSISRGWLAGAILIGTSLAALVTGFAFLVQSGALSGASQLPGWIATLQPDMLNQLFTGGLIGGALFSLLWLAQPLPLEDRLLLFVLFGLALAGALLQSPAADNDDAKHVWLLIALITLTEGVVLAARMNRVHAQRQ